MAEELAGVGRYTCLTDYYMFQHKWMDYLLTAGILLMLVANSVRVPYLRLFGVLMIGVASTIALIDSLRRRQRLKKKLEEFKA